MRTTAVQSVVCVLIAFAFAIPAATFASPAVKTDDVKDWTLLMYWDADNSLEFCTEFAMATWEKALPSNEHINIVALIDILSVEGTWIYDFVDGRRNLVATWPEKNTSDPAILTEFIEYGMGNYPAQKTMLVLQDHGYSWRGICQDETNGDSLMPIHGVAKAITDAENVVGKGIDLLAFDACNMQTIDVAYELRDAVPLVVGSETTVPFDGLPYMMFVTDLVNDPSLSPENLAVNIVNEYVLYYSSKWDYEHINKYSQDFATIAAVKTSGMAALGDAWSELTRVLLPIIPDHKKDVQYARGYALVGIWTNMASIEWTPDVYTFVEGLRAIPGHPELISAIDAFEAAHDGAILAEGHSKKYHDTVHGLNFWFPPSLSQYNNQGWVWARQFVYHDAGLDLVAESAWYECLMAYYA